MKLQSILRMQAIILGFAAALFLAASAPAQDIHNTVWNDGPDTSTSLIAQATPEPTSTTAAAQTSQASTPVPSPVATKVSLSEVTPVNLWLFTLAIFFIGMVVLLVRTEVRRYKSNLSMRVAHAKKAFPLS